MELSESVLEGLKVAGSSSLSDQLFSSLLSRAVDISWTSVDDAASAASKEAYSALAVLLYEAARVDADSASLNSVLEECQFSPARSKQLTDILVEKKAELRGALDRVGHCAAHVVDVDWRLDYYIKNNRLERVNQPEYLIALSTSHDQPLSDTSDTNTVQFSCSQEQLQDLVQKLKDATKSLDKFTSN